VTAGAVDGLAAAAGAGDGEAAADGDAAAAGDADADGEPVVAGELAAAGAAGFAGSVGFGALVGAVAGAGAEEHAASRALPAPASSVVSIVRRESIPDRRSMFIPPPDRQERPSDAILGTIDRRTFRTSRTRRCTQLADV